MRDSIKTITFLRGREIPFKDCIGLKSTILTLLFLCPQQSAVLNKVAGTILMLNPMGTQKEK